MKDYKQIDCYVHALSQIIAKISNSFIPAEDDDSHANLRFDPLGQRIIGRWIESDKGQFLFSLNLARYSFEWLNIWQEPVRVYPIEWKTLANLQDEIARDLESVGLEPEKFEAKLNYELPAYDFEAKPFPAQEPGELKYWMQIREQANNACQKLLDFLQMESEIRIWPHHFDTGIYVELYDKLALGFGWALADSITDDPYFYMTAYGINCVVNYQTLPQLSFGRWEIKPEWKGAVLTLSDIQKFEEQGSTCINEFILSAYMGFISSLQVERMSMSK